MLDNANFYDLMLKYSIFQVLQLQIIKLLRLLYWNKMLEIILFKMYHDIMFFSLRNCLQYHLVSHTIHGYFANSFEIIFIFFLKPIYDTHFVV